MRKICTALLLLVPATAAICQVIPNNSIYPGTTTQGLQTVPAGYAGNFSLNLVRVWEPQIPLSAEADVISSTRTTTEVRQSATYFDGLGRPVQTVVKKSSHANNSYSNAKDIVTPVIYDEFGREVYKYLPYVDTGAYGQFKLNPFATQASFMQQTHNPANNGSGEKFFYSKSEIEPSPLNRVTKALAPGNSWIGNNRGVSMAYEFNEASEVRLWTISMTAGSYASSSAYYAANELSRTITTDEHGKRVVEYKDKEGLVILKKVEISTSAATLTAHTGWLCTYYVYDDVNNLRFVIPPKATEAVVSSGSISSTIANELCFRYEYDTRKRMVIKKVPGAGEVKMVYDERDRLVMVQDGNLNGAKWLVTQYDNMNRPLRTYLWNNTGSQSTHQASASSSSSYPTLSGTYQLLTETYYDNYTWVSGSGSGLSSTLNTAYTGSADYISSYNSSPLYAQQVTTSSAVKGMATGTKVLVLGTSSTFLYSVSLYDSKGRVIQVQSKNIGNGTDVMTVQYDFAGKVLKSQVSHDYPANGQVVKVLTVNEYDHAGRLITIKKKINSGSEKLIAKMQYDELGQLQSKKLGENPQVSGSARDTLDYTYNIRGWLTGINRGYANPNNTSEASTQAHRWFGMQLSYDFGFEESSTAKNQYNGNIAGIRWKSNGSDEQRAYGFAYDAANRLLKGDFTQYTSSTWNTSAGIDFSMKMGDGSDPAAAYDANGNIKAMWQMGLKIDHSDVIDEMTYTYNTSSNKLLGITETNGAENNHLGDFRDRNESDYDYEYDDNGNMVRDYNKNILVEYNHLNLPVMVNAYDDNDEDKGYIQYTYDALGNKLKKFVSEDPVEANSYTHKEVTTVYVAGFVYEGSYIDKDGEDPITNEEKLQFIAHEEGRIRRIVPADPEELAEENGGGIFNYNLDYFIKDHLGNVRMVLTDEQKTDVYLATMEEAQDEFENKLFLNRVNLVAEPGCFDGEPDGKVQKIGPVDDGGMIVGSGLVLKVMAGDHVNANVFGWFDYGEQGNNPTETDPIEDVITNLFSGGISQSGPKGNLAGMTASSLVPGILQFLSNQPNYETGQSAYLNWVLLDDEQLKLVQGGSGFKSLVAAMEVEGGAGCDVPKVLLQANDGDGIDITKNGYLYIYLSNTNDTYPVFFDDLHVEHIRGPLVEETHYYPFGLTMAGISSKAAGGIENKYKFNGIEQNADFDINTYDAFYRNLDPQIGRFLQIDPVTTHSESPYVAMGNNPVLNKDWLGDYYTWGNQSVHDRYDRMRKENGDKIAGYMNELSGLDINSTDKNVQGQIKELTTLINMHGELNSQWNEMDASDIEFHVTDEKPTEKGAAGTAGYSSGRVNIKVGADNKKSDIMAHEFRHGYSYINGELMKGGMLNDMTDEVVAYNAGFLFLDRSTASLVAKGFYDVDWFKKNHLNSELYKHLTGKEQSLTTNTLASTVMQYNPNARISFLLGLNKNNANLTTKEAMDILNGYSKMNPPEFQYQNLLKNR